MYVIKTCCITIIRSSFILIVLYPDFFFALSFIHSSSRIVFYKVWYAAKVNAKSVNLNRGEVLLFENTSPANLTARWLQSRFCLNIVRTCRDPNVMISIMVFYSSQNGEIDDRCRVEILLFETVTCLAFFRPCLEWRFDHC